jgi:hypothetical protein
MFTLDIYCGEAHKIGRELGSATLGSLKKLHDVLAIDEILLRCDLQLFPESVDLTADSNDFLTNRVTSLVVETRAVQDGSHF